MILPRAPATGGRKPPRHEIASGDSAPAVPQASGATKCYGDLGTRRDAEDMRFATGMRLDREYNLDVTARKSFADWAIASSGSKGLESPRQFAVAGMNWATPCAPARLTAAGSNRLSC